MDEENVVPARHGHTVLDCSNSFPAQDFLNTVKCCRFSKYIFQREAEHTILQPQLQDPWN